jgi:hypothetical protein
MKKKSGLLMMAASAALLAMGTMMVSCQRNSEDPLSAATSQTVSNETTQDAQQDEVDDMASNSLGNTDSPSGRVDGKFTFEDYRISCAVVTRDTTGLKTKGSGKITIDFGAGCTDKFGNVRAGKIMISWTGGRWFNAGAVYVITFSGYSINEVKFSDNDIRTVTNVSTNDHPLLFNVVASHLLTWPDNTTATREVHKTREWIRSATVVDDKFIVSQTSAGVPAAMGKTRRDVAYSVAITTPLEYDRSCMISNRVFKPVKGVKVITYDTNKVVTIDFGDGSCDRTFTISADGRTRTFNVKNDSSED